MASAGVLLTSFAAFSLVSSMHGVEGAMNLTREEDLELDRQLKLLNKPAIKSIQTKYEDIFDCVDIYKQPAFDHPLLKNHTIQHAKIRVTRDKYYGGQAWINIYKVPVGANQGTATQLWISNGRRDNENVIEVGWTRDGYRTTRCYNYHCPGFVQVNCRVSLGAVLGPYSTYNGPQYEDRFLVWKDPESGNWWFVVSEEYIGYWPKTLFTSLADCATAVDWGGQVFGPQYEPSPQMGSGHFPSEGVNKACSFGGVRTVTKSNVLVDPNILKVRASLDAPKCYGADLEMHHSFGVENIIYAGGPGGY